MDSVSNDRVRATMAIEAIFFDAAGTLMQPARAVGASYSLLAAKYGCDVSSADLTKRFRGCFEASPPLAFPEADGSQLCALERAWWKKLVADVFQPWGAFDRFDDYFTELFEYFGQAAAWTLYPEVAPTLRRLRQQGLVLAVISNFDSRLIGILAGLGIGDCFDGVFTSTAVGHAKPDPRIFQSALRRYGLSPAEAVHVGDSPRNDLAGAASAGLRGILIDREVPAAMDGARIRALDEIFSIALD